MLGLYENTMYAKDRYDQILAAQLRASRSGSLPRRRRSPGLGRAFATIVCFIRTLAAKRQPAARACQASA
jgi:hypothetical protein